MNIKRLIITALAFIIFLAGWSCKKEEQAEQGAADVQFSVPEKMEIESEAEEISFRIQFGKAPVVGDKVIFEDQDSKTYTCPVKSVNSSNFLADAAELWSKNIADGLHQVYFQRGSANRKLMGETKVVIVFPDDPGIAIEPATGSTVYGRVSCSGEGIANVVVSDGVEVVQTDKDGIYQLASKKRHNYVFISVPSGYEVPRDGIVPLFFRTLAKSASVAERVDFSLKKVDGQDKHTVLMMGDMHLANRTNDRNQFKDFVKDVNTYVSSHPSDHIYGLTLGDMTWDLYWLDNNYGYSQYIADAKTMTGLPIFHTIGNHDHSMYYTGDFDTVKEYKALLGPTYYSFNIGKVHYVVLDDIECTNSTLDSGSSDGRYKRDYNGKIVDEQFTWLRKDLALVPTTTPIVLTMHIPMWDYSGKYYAIAKASENTLANILKTYPEAHVFTAHTHTVYNHDRLSSSHLFEHNAGSVCGTWWWSGNETPGVHIGQDGSPGGYTILTVDGTAFKWQYKASKKDVSFQFRAYDRNTIHLTNDNYIPDANSTYAKDFSPDFWGTSSTANEVYINVWNYDPSWKVEVSEGGKALTVEHLSGDKAVLDPLHLVAYTAKRLNKNKAATFATTPNEHTFRVVAAAPNSTLEIKVTDRFGNVYTESMTRPRTFSTDTYKF